MKRLLLWAPEAQFPWGPSKNSCGTHSRTTPLEDRETGHCLPTPIPHWWRVAPATWAPLYFQSTPGYLWREGTEQEKALPQRSELRVLEEGSSWSSPEAAGRAGWGMWDSTTTFHLLFCSLLTYAPKVLNQPNVYKQGRDRVEAVI